MQKRDCYRFSDSRICVVCACELTSTTCTVAGPSEAGWQGRPGQPHFLCHFFLLKTLNLRISVRVSEMALSGGGSQLPAPATHHNLLPFTFPSVCLEVVKHSFQRQGFDKAARGGLLLLRG